MMEVAAHSVTTHTATSDQTGEHTQLPMTKPVTTHSYQ